MTDAEKEEIKRFGLERYNIVCSECGKKANIYTGSGIGFSYMKPGAMLPSTKYIRIFSPLSASRWRKIKRLKKSSRIMLAAWNL